MNYKSLVLSGAFRIDERRCMVNTSLLNEVAKLWAMAERGVDVMRGTDTAKDVPPL